jgi:hypothetical protein
MNSIKGHKRRKIIAEISLLWELDLGLVMFRKCVLSSSLAHQNVTTQSKTNVTESTPTQI